MDKVAKLQMDKDENRDEELDNGSRSKQLDGDFVDEVKKEELKKRYCRHSTAQIRELEDMYNKCPKPNNEQRQMLIHATGLKPSQVKFWFQNRRTQRKAQEDRDENKSLKEEHEDLKAENLKLQLALRNSSCQDCGSLTSYDEQFFGGENARLKSELDRLNSIIASYTGGKQIHAAGVPPPPPQLLPFWDQDIRKLQDPMGGTNSQMIHLPFMADPMGRSSSQMIHLPFVAENTDILSGMMTEEEKQSVMDLAGSALRELVMMCQTAEPLWVRTGGREQLNIEEHGKLFNHQKLLPCPFLTEATRESTVVKMDSNALVDAFLDVSKWMDLFPSIISRAQTIQTASTGTTGHPSGSLQLMCAEMHALSPLVPTREALFFRYCQQDVKNKGIWVIVDFPAGSFREIHRHNFRGYCRRTSGCIIWDLYNGYSKVTWVEQANIKDEVVHQIFNDFIRSGMAFGARRWLSVLQQQCDRLASLMERNIPDVEVSLSREARRSMLNLSHRMIKTFCFNISSSGGQSWTTVSDSYEDVIRITKRTTTAPGQPSGIIFCAVTTTRLQFSHSQIFKLLRNEHCVYQLDNVSGQISSEKSFHIAEGSHFGNSIFLDMIISSDPNQNEKYALLESSTTVSGSLIVYSFGDFSTFTPAICGGDPSDIRILPSGFVITPMDPYAKSNDRKGKAVEDGNGQAASCLLTVGLQTLANPNPTGELNLSDANSTINRLKIVVEKIKVALLSNNIASCVRDNTGTSGGSATVLTGFD